MLEARGGILDAGRIRAETAARGTIRRMKDELGSRDLARAMHG
jgi:hypothetical protein